MILQALTNYYDRLESDPDADVAGFGFSREKISFCMVLSPDGTPVQIDDIRVREEPKGKSTKARISPARMVVPDRGSRSGTLIKSNFLWDNSGYALGCDGKGKPERSRQAFEAFRDLHLEFANEVEDVGLTALCKFLESWDTDAAAGKAAELAHLEWEEICDTNVVFRLDGQHRYLHDSEALKNAWSRRVSAEGDSQPGFCLVSGEADRLARLHPMIRGVAGAQSSGAAIASFNLDAFESYGKQQSFNAPVGLRTAFRYTTALNRLVSDKKRRLHLSGATIVYWTDRPTPFESMFGSFVDSVSAEDAATLAQLHGFLTSVHQGRTTDDLTDADVGFHVLGISPNASRLAIRFWLTGTVREFAARLDAHSCDLEMGYANPKDPPLTIRRMLDQTARERKDVKPLLEGMLIRSVLTGGPYPQTLFTSVLRRINADGYITHHRVAILKAYLVRKARLAGRKEDIPMTLDVNRPDCAYNLGRLFAVLEKTQHEASGGQHSTIKDHYFSTASATPASAFPRIMRLHAHHLNKIEHGGRRTNIEKLIQDICSHIENFPSHLSLDGQGQFCIGYYHQRQDFFTKKTDNDE
ncbi:MAG TPA: type I-C CRISPR-associated protein Cas8c/Csd1 [Phycisphaerae bacterium]|nr:type I-C CRISPR-associated protein Cas8c/Csd1 [Phycisphaerae bacterium]